MEKTPRNPKPSKQVKAKKDQQKKVKKEKPVNSFEFNWRLSAKAMKSQHFLFDLVNKCVEYSKSLKPSPSVPLKTLMREYPLHPAKFFKGTQIFTVRLYTDFTLVTSNGSSIVNLVIGFDPANFLNFSSHYSLVFDEYKAIRGGVEFVSSSLGGTASTGVLAITVDYDNGSALTSYTTASAFDTCRPVKIFNNTHFTPVMFDGTPDRDWVNCTSSVAAAWCKFFGNSTTGITASATWGIARAWYDIQIRQA